MYGVLVLKRAVPTWVYIIALAAELEVAVAVDRSLSLSLSKRGLLILLSSGEQQVNYWDRRHAAIGIKPRSPRSSLGPQKRGNKMRAQDLASQSALSSLTAGAAVSVVAAAAPDFEGARPEPYGRGSWETRTDIVADAGDGDTVDVEGKTPEPVSALAIKSKASPGKSTSSGGSGATGKNGDRFGEARNDNGVTHTSTVKCVNEACQGCHLCSEPGGAVVNDAEINKTVGTRLTGQPVAVKPAISIGGKAVASLVTTAGPRKNGVSHDTEAAAARPSWARIRFRKHPRTGLWYVE